MRRSVRVRLGFSVVAALSLVAAAERPSHAVGWVGTSGMSSAGSAAVAAPGQNRTDFFVRGLGPDFSLWHRMMDQNGFIGSWDNNAGAPPVSGGLTSTPAALYQSNPTGGERWNVVGLAGNTLYYTYYQTANGGWKQPWLALPNGVLTTGAAMTLNSSNRIDVWAAGQGPQRAIWHTTILADTNPPTLPGGWDGAAGAPTSPLGVNGAPAAFSRSVGQVDLVVQSADDHMLWHRNFDGTSWSTWTRLAQFLDTVVVEPALSSVTAGRLDVFARGSDGRLYHTSFATRQPGPALPWDADAGSPQAAGPSGAGALAAAVGVSVASAGNGVVNLFGVDSNSTLYVRPFTVLPTVAVAQNRYDRQATAANLNETLLDPQNVNASKFGRLFSYPVQGNIVAQPLYVPQLAVSGKGTRNVVFVATMKDHLYCFDADSNQASDGGLMWEVDFLQRAGAGATPFPAVDATGVHSEHLDNFVGILSTPIIDRTTNTMYLVVNSKQNSRKRTRLHAIDVTTGNERAGSPVDIAATLNNGAITFDTQVQLQRAGLAMSGNNVILAFSSHDDILPNYRGWVIAYDKSSLQRTGAYAAITQGAAYGGGIWMAGRPPVVDDQGFIYLFTGNGFGANANDGSANLSESAIKLNPAGLTRVASFTPANWAALDFDDLDLASSGPLLIPGTSRLVGGGKEGLLYTWDTSAMTLTQNPAPKVVENPVSGPMHHIMSGPAFWPRSAAAGGPLLFNSGEYDQLRAFQFTGSGVTLPAKWASNEVYSGHPAGITALSAYGERADSGIVWTYAHLPPVMGITEVVPGVLRAYDAAAGSARLLWTNQDSLARDDGGLFGKFCVPTVVNGKVYLGTWSNQLVVYGPLPATPAFTMKAMPARLVALGRQATYTATPFRLNGYNETLSWTVAGLPAGASSTIASPAADGSVKISITVAAGTPNGVYPVAVTATGTTLVRSQNVLLEVEGSMAISNVGRSIVSVDSQETATGQVASNVLDQNPATVWITQYANPPAPGQPHTIVIDLGARFTITGFSYLSRQDGCANGAVRRFEGSVSLDTKTWGAVMADGSFDYETASLNCDGTNPGRLRKQNVLFREPKVGRFFRFTSTLEVNLGPWTAAAEFELYTNGVPAGAFPTNATAIQAIRGSDGTGWIRAYANNQWLHWDTVGGGLAGDPVVVGSAGTWDLFMRGTDGGLWTGTLSNGVWSGWSTLGTPPSRTVAARPAAIKTAAGQIDVVVRGSDGVVYARTRTSGSWGAWTTVSGSIQDDPALVLLPNGTEMVFGRATGSSNVVTATKSATWSSWASLPARAFSSPPAVVSHPDGRVDVFGIGTDRAVWTLSRIGTTWGTAWSGLGGDVTGSFVTPLLETNDDVSVFALGTNDHRVWANRRPAASANWGGWNQIGTSFSYTAGNAPLFGDAPRALLDPDQQVQLLLPASSTDPQVNGQIFHDRRLNGAWGLWVPSN